MGIIIAFPSRLTPDTVSAMTDGEHAMEILDQLRGGLIVSCQAPRRSPLRDPRIIAAISLAAERAGAVGLRVNAVDHIEMVRATSSLPIIGLVKRIRPGRGQVITPTVDDALSALEAGADIIAFDAMNDRREADSRAEIIGAVHRHGGLVMADIAAAPDAVAADGEGADIVASTLAPALVGHEEEPDLDLVRALRRRLPQAFIVAEGRVSTPTQVAEAFRAGASSVVVGTALTDPYTLTSRFAAASPRGEARVPGS